MLRAKRFVYHAVCVVWAVAFLTLFGFMVARALPPGASLWDLAPVSQEGQLSIYNAVSGGGWYGHPVELGDYDGDGHTDLVLAPMAADSGLAPKREKSGEVYVYQGDGEIAGVLDRWTTVGAARGLTLRGARPGDFLGTELFSADVNGDGITDLLVSAQNHDESTDPAGDDCGPDCRSDCRDNAGAVWVLFGRTGLLDEERIIDLAQGEEVLAQEGVLKISGATPGERFGIWVEAGDLDGDGIDEIIAGADLYPNDSNALNQYAGKTYVIYGREVYPDFIDLASFEDEVSVILGKDFNDHFGASLHAADLDADGRDELIVAAALNRLSASFAGCSAFRAVAYGGGGVRPEPDSPYGPGEIYVFHSDADDARLPALIDLRTDQAELMSAGRLTVIRGESVGDFAGEELTSGDFNGDGFTDLAIGALTAPDAGGDLNEAGRAYIVYWKQGLGGRTIDLAELEPSPGGPLISTLVGENPDDIFGDTLSAGDFDHDGIDDLAVGIPHGDLPGELNAGIVAIVYGREDPLPRYWTPQADESPAGIRLAFVLGARNQDLMSYSMEAGDYDGDGYSDLYPNAMRGDGAADAFLDAGEAYVVSGFRISGGALRLRSVSPAVGPLGEPIPVTLLGEGFTTAADTTIEIDGLAVESFEVLSATRIDAVFPARSEPSTSSVTLVNRYGSVTLDGAFRYGGAAPGFVRGDSNRDSILDISDPVHVLTVLFVGNAFICRDASDANDDGDVNVSDVLYGLVFLFQEGPAFPAPYPEPGEDATPDGLDCLE